MKKEIILILVFLVLIASPVNSVIYDSIHEYLHKIDRSIPLVVGLNATSSDSIAATKIVLAILQQKDIILDVTTEDKVSPNINKVLIGHSCDNSLIPLNCNEWPYEPGEGIIRVIGNDLIISGTTEEDTRRAAIVAANYKLFQLLKISKFVIVKGTSFDLGNIEVIAGKEEFVCGDQVCEEGEKFTCYVDCQQISCSKLCKDLNFNDASCRPTSPFVNKSSCNSDENDHGIGYCSSGRSCCCSNEKIQENKTQEIKTEPKAEIIKQEPKKDSMIKKVLLFFAKPKTVELIIILAVLGALGYLAYYYLRPS